MHLDISDLSNTILSLSSSVSDPLRHKGDLATARQAASHPVIQHTIHQFHHSISAKRKHQTSTQGMSQR